MNKIKCADCRNILESGACYMIWANVAIYPTQSIERNCKWFVHKDTPIFPVVGFDSEAKCVVVTTDNLMSEQSCK